MCWNVESQTMRLVRHAETAQWDWPKTPLVTVRHFHLFSGGGRIVCIVGLVAGTTAELFLEALVTKPWNIFGSAMFPHYIYDMSKAFASWWPAGSRKGLQQSWILTSLSLCAGWSNGIDSNHGPMALQSLLFNSWLKMCKHPSTHFHKHFFKCKARRKTRRLWRPMSFRATAWGKPGAKIATTGNLLWSSSWAECCRRLRPWRILTSIYNYTSIKTQTSTAMKCHALSVQVLTHAGSWHLLHPTLFGHLTPQSAPGGACNLETSWWAPCDVPCPSCHPYQNFESHKVCLRLHSFFWEKMATANGHQDWSIHAPHTDHVAPSHVSASFAKPVWDVMLSEDSRFAFRDFQGVCEIFLRQNDILQDPHAASSGLSNGSWGCSARSPGCRSWSQSEKDGASCRMGRNSPTNPTKACFICLVYLEHFWNLQVQNKTWPASISIGGTTKAPSTK